MEHLGVVLLAEVLAAWKDNRLLAVMKYQVDNMVL